MFTSPLVQTEHDCTQPYCRIRRAADVVAFYASGVPVSPWYLTPDHHVISAADSRPYPVHSPKNGDAAQASAAILASEYIAFAQPDLLLGLSQVLLERSETHKLNECFYCKTKHEDCPSLILSDLILSLPVKIREIPSDIPCPTTQAE